MNEEKFNNKGYLYAGARPSYPDELLQYLLNRNILSSESIVADIGSGTGIFTTQIAPYVHTVYAVEPNDDMRKQADAIFRSYSNIVSVNGTAEHTSLAEHCVDCITVAQAFHWFDRKAFQTECSAVLKDQGKVILVWNDRDATSEIVKQNYDINAVFCPSFKGASAGISFSPKDFDDFFRSHCEYIAYEKKYRYDLTAFLERNLSSSYAPLKTDCLYDKYILALTELFEKSNTNGYIDYPYITRCYIGDI